MSHPHVLLSRRWAVWLGVATTAWVTGCSSPPKGAANISSAGPYLGVENHLGPNELAADLRAAARFRATKYPGGFVTVFGGSGVKEFNPPGPWQSANDQLYREVYALAHQWTTSGGAKRHPILTGAGPGLMEAASRGAMDAGGPSIGYTTYYGPSRGNGGDARLAFQRYVTASGETNAIISDGLIFSSVAVRESMMILHSAAMVFAPGGTGTEWEIFQVLETVKSEQLTPVPIFFYGRKDLHWASFYARLKDMHERGTVDQARVLKWIRHVETPEELVRGLKEVLPQ